MDAFPATSGGAESVNEGVFVLARIPLDSNVSSACDAGAALDDETAAGAAISKLVFGEFLILAFVYVSLHVLILVFVCVSSSFY